MPKTAEKRAQARRQNRVQRAHTGPATATRPAVRYASPAQRRPGQRPKRRGFFSRYPVATFIGAVLVIGLAVLYLQQNKLGPFTPPPPKPVAQATCDLKTHVCTKAPIMTINTAKTYTATIETAKGNIVIQLDAKNTPITVNNFVFLAQQHFYDNTYFWRVEAPGLTSPLGGSSTLQLIQGGSVTNNGQDPATIPGYTIQDEKVTGSYIAGDIAMANTGKPHTGSTQFFICTGDNSKLLAKSYTIFGHVISGMDVATKISPQDVIKTVTIQVK
ncbi:MAG TPA: peptidylprolyl isomerase [Ktedonobacterales bacterium]|jgi:cyclophilin family peptidyl-prolyl cis-trans isomerase|nr:peptidylprolyl isomerase [Ktedonobacterales bacterium]